MTRNRTSADFLNGVPELVILQLLAQRPRYGYELVAAIREQSGQVLRFGEGCVYPILHRLEAEGLLSARREQVGGRSRVVYRVTRQGTRRLQGSAAQWRQVAQAVHHVLCGGEHGSPFFAGGAA